MNGGDCLNSIDFSSYTCSCTGDYTGRDCELPIPCNFSPCNNNHTLNCYNSGDYLDFDCECSEEYTGETCDVYRGCFYVNGTCLNGGTCYYDDTTDVTYLPEYTDRNVTDWLCTCEGYTGGYVEELVK